MFLLAQGRRFDTKKCQILPKTATSKYIENRSFGDQITSPLILSNKKQLKWGDGILWAKRQFYIENIKRISISVYGVCFTG